MARWWLALVALAVSATTHAQPTTLERNARALIEGQLLALNSQTFLATLPPDAVILGNGSFAVARDRNAAAIVATLGRVSGTVSVLGRIDAGGTGGVMWFSADVGWLDVDEYGCGTRARLVEIAVADHATWKVVAVSFTSTSPSTAPGDALAAPGTGALTTYLGSPDKLDGALRDDPATTVVLGEPGQLGELGLGRDGARRVLEPLHSREVTVTGAIEVHAATWAFAAGELAIGADPHQVGESRSRAQVLLVAVPEDHRWKVVALHVIGQKDGPLVRRVAPCTALPETSTSLQKKTIEP